MNRKRVNIEKSMYYNYGYICGAATVGIVLSIHMVITAGEWWFLGICLIGAIGALVVRKAVKDYEKLKP